MLEQIKKANDIKEIAPEDYQELAAEIRSFLIEKISKTGGHLASNLGVVELTMAMHLTFTLPEDKIIWDVGHQSYTHKLLTGRTAGFDELRCFGGLSGFPKPGESECDAFGTGHSSTSISAGLGYVRAREIKGEDYQVISVIGDGSLTGGMAYEALNNASQVKSNFIIVLNDNHMSISENVGGISKYLNRLRSAELYHGLKKGVEETLEYIPGVGKPMIRQLKKAKNSLKQLVIPGMLFEDMGITYLGPVAGHDVEKLCKTFREARRIKGPVLVHVLTEKGRGYEPAIAMPDKFHGVGPFDIETGESLSPATKDSYTDVFGKVLTDIAMKDETVVAITAAMADGTGLKRFASKFPKRFFDVGIAEEHAVTFAAGLACAGMKPVFAVYSSFLQRGFDQLIHDVALQKLPVVFAVDRGGLVGNDGDTHQGIFDLSYLSMIPNMTVMSPKHKWELADMLRFAFKLQGPVAIRYPRGSAFDAFEEYREEIALGKSEWIYREEEVAIISVGHMFSEAVLAYKKLKEAGRKVSLINARFVKPLDTQMIEEVAKTHSIIYTVEENVKIGGFGSQVADYAEEHSLPVKVCPFALPDDYVEQGNVEVLREVLGLNGSAIAEKIEKDLKG
ncbi:1-deoxy-D-xylulose-5-phosphate synthase [Ohessyouella blattaphilus]|uniref:1-deoxy-D-xylulose-5-phosphate synthase n=1 Tax=Ohessyouella blattaphilus TaxID=2949333 RepID=A0ABT1END9_9FIRM|nr:1-deoxy-D-xylulose-5-phosphate synthase [Ohessyouella blattaphilus]MCP1111226.1 1-deoxy-D-xylulose-5-phosphate synthase [Ohessyouella blattaphilus]MCR8564620.1 1-deoxy-D-xylulose-5-phosphate synthase [Ohessyouella blattaphilus]